MADDGSTPSAHAVRREGDEALQKALAQLPERERQVIEWRTYEHCSFEEIGRRLQALRRSGPQALGTGC